MERAPRRMAPPVPPPPEDDASDDSSIDFELCIGNEEPSTAQQDDEPEECAICYDAHWDPVRLPNCSHVFCRSCLTEVCRRGDKRCPLCRVDLPGLALSWLVDAPTEADIERRLREQFPEMWARRRAEAELRAAGSIAFHVGHRRTDDGGVRLFAAVRPPNGWRPRRPGGPDASALLIEKVRFTLPPALIDSGTGEDGVVEVCEAPFELSCRVTPDAIVNGPSAAVQAHVVWKRKLGLAPHDVEHVLRDVHDGGAGAGCSSTPYEARLPEGLTLARVLTRMRPVALVGVGSGHMREVYR